MPAPFPHLLSPGRIGTMALRNRIVMAPMGEELAAVDGTVSDDQLAYVGARAAGGAALVMLGSVAVSWPAGTANERQNGLSDERFVPGLARLAEVAHRAGAKVAIQLTHMGKVARNDVAAGRPLWVPSVPRPVTHDPLLAMVTAEEAEAQLAPFRQPAAKVEYRVMDRGDIDHLVEEFAAAAERAQRSGVDGVELHAGHGYLIDEFLSPAANSRTDAYGGRLEHRARLLVEVVRAVRERVGRGYPVWVRLNGEELFVDGTTVDDAVRTAELIEAAGVDAVHVSAYADPMVAIGFTESHTTHHPGGLVPYARAVKRRVRIPVIAVGRIDPELADRLIGEGACDLVAMGRRLLADPDLPARLGAGRPEEARPCVYHYRCISQIFVRQGVRCAVNPATGRERELALRRTAVPRRIVVAGGGPAGMETARRCALRGHDVVLVEASDRLGGKLAYAARTAPTYADLLSWLVGQVDAVGVEVRVGQAVTPDLARSLVPDALVDATGGRWGRPAVAGADGARVRTVDDLAGWVLGNGSLSGDRVVVLGGGCAGLGLAALAHDQGHPTTVLEPTGVLAPELGLPGRWRLVHELRERGVTLVLHATVTAIADAAVVHRTGGEERITPADVVVVATAPTAVARPLAPPGVEVHRVGDCGGAGHVEGAMLDAATLAVTL